MLSVFLHKACASRENAHKIILFFFWITVLVRVRTYSLRPQSLLSSSCTCFFLFQGLRTYRKVITQKNDGNHGLTNMIFGYLPYWAYRATEGGKPFAFLSIYWTYFAQKPFDMWLHAAKSFREARILCRSNMLLPGVLKMLSRNKLQIENHVFGQKLGLRCCWRRGRRKLTFSCFPEKIMIFLPCWPRFGYDFFWLDLHSRGKNSGIPRGRYQLSIPPFLDRSALDSYSDRHIKGTRAGQTTKNFMYGTGKNT